MIAAQAQLVLVTGPSGAGRSTAIHALEDLGFETIDNLPLHLVPRLLEGAPERPMALVIDVRNRDFSSAALVRLADERGIDMTAVDEPALDVLWLEAKTLTAGP